MLSVTRADSLLSGVILSVLLLGLSSCFTHSTQTDNITHLSVYMEQRYRRELEKDRFSINYVPTPPDTILIRIQFYPNADRTLISTLVDSAKEIIHRIGSEQFHLDQVNINVEMKEIDFPKRRPPF